MTILPSGWDKRVTIYLNDTLSKEIECYKSVAGIAKYLNAAQNIEDEYGHIHDYSVVEERAEGLNALLSANNSRYKIRIELTGENARIYKYSVQKLK